MHEVVDLRKSLETANKPFRASLSTLSRLMSSGEAIDGLTAWPTIVSQAGSSLQIELTKAKKDQATDSRSARAWPLELDDFVQMSTKSSDTYG